MKKAINFQSLLADARQVFQNPKFSPDCPDGEEIVDYVYGDLSGPAILKVSKHIFKCESCRLLALKIETDRTELELMIEQSPKTFVETIMGPLVEKDSMGKMSHDLKKGFQSLSRIKDTLISWISPAWEPQFAGQVVTAADIVEQTRQFEMDCGEYVTISCNWKGKERSQEAHLNLSWKANFHTPRNIWIRFLDPESNSTLSELNLGKHLEGYRQIPIQELNFDPTERRWAISVITEDL